MTEYGKVDLETKEIIQENISLPNVLKKPLITGFKNMSVEVHRSYGYYPKQYDELSENQRHGDPIVEELYIRYPAEDIPAEEILTKQITEAIGLIGQLVQDKVNEYNTAHNLALQDVYRCEAYSHATGYTHQQFCTDIWAWNVSLWEAARSIQEQVVSGEISMPSTETFLDMLPEYTGAE